MNAVLAGSVREQAMPSGVPEPGGPTGASGPGRSLWASWLATPDRQARFEDVVLQYFLKRGRPVLVRGGAVLFLDSLGRDRTDPDAPAGMEPVAADNLRSHQSGLTNLSQVCAQHAEWEWPGLVADFFDTHDRARAQLVRAEEEAPARLLERLVVRLHDTQVVDAIVFPIARRNEIPGLDSVLCLDLPEAIVTVSPTQVAQWGLAHDELFRIALANVERLVTLRCTPLRVDPENGGSPPGNESGGEQQAGLDRVGDPPEPEHPDYQDFQPSPGIEYPHADSSIVHADSYYAASMALVPGALDAYFGAFGAIVGLPVRNAMTVLRFDDPSFLRAIGHHLGLTVDMYNAGPGSISPRIWWVRPGRWLEIPYQVEDGHVHMRAPDELVDLINSLADDDP